MINSPCKDLLLSYIGFYYKHSFKQPKHIIDNENCTENKYLLNKQRSTSSSVASSIFFLLLQENVLFFNIIFTSNRVVYVITYSLQITEPRLCHLRLAQIHHIKECLLKNE